MTVNSQIQSIIIVIFFSKAFRYIRNFNFWVLIWKLYDMHVTILFIFGHTFLICWITLPADLKNWDFKKKKGGIWRSSGEKRNYDGRWNIVTSYNLSFNI